LARVSNQHLDELRAGLVHVVRRLVVPLVAHGDARLPGAVQGHAGKVLLRRLDGAAGDDGIRLRVPYDLAQALGGPVEEHEVDLAVAGHQLPELGPVVLHEPRVLPGRHPRVGRPGHGLAGAVQPMEVVRREVEANRDAFVAEGLHDGGGDVLAEGRAHDVEVRRLRVPHAEAGVVLGREDDVLHAREPGEGRPVRRVELAGVEATRKFLEEAPRVVLVRARERVADHAAQRAVDAPVDEEPEAEVTEPLETLRLVAGGLLDLRGDDRRQYKQQRCDGDGALQRAQARAPWFEDRAEH
jgi:hypothetical protein